MASEIVERCGHQPEDQRLVVAGAGLLSSARHPDLQWRIGAGYDQLRAAVREHVPAGSSAAFAVLDGGEVWATLIVGFDTEHRVALITTADPSSPLSGSSQEVLEGLVSLARERHGACDTGAVVERGTTTPTHREPTVGEPGPQSVE